MRRGALTKKRFQSLARGGSGRARRLSALPGTRPARSAGCVLRRGLGCAERSRVGLGRSRSPLLLGTDHVARDTAPVPRSFRGRLTTEHRVLAPTSTRRRFTGVSPTPDSTQPPSDRKARATNHRADRRRRVPVMGLARWQRARSAEMPALTQSDEGLGDAETGALVTVLTRPLEMRSVRLPRRDGNVATRARHLGSCGGRKRASA